MKHIHIRSSALRYHYSRFVFGKGTPEAVPSSVKNAPEGKKDAHTDTLHPEMSKVAEGTNWSVTADKGYWPELKLNKSYADKLPTEVKQYFKANHIAFPRVSVGFNTSDPKNTSLRDVTFGSGVIHSESSDGHHYMAPNNFTRYAERNNYPLTADEKEFDSLFGNKACTKELLQHIETWVIQKCIESTAIHGTNEQYYGQLLRGTNYAYNPKENVVANDNANAMLSPEDQKDAKKLGVQFKVKIGLGGENGRSIKSVNFSEHYGNDWRERSHHVGQGDEFNEKELTTEVLKDINGSAAKSLKNELLDIRKSKEKERNDDLSNIPQHIKEVVTGTKWKWTIALKEMVFSEIFGNEGLILHRKAPQSDIAIHLDKKTDFETITGVTIIGKNGKVSPAYLSGFGEREIDKETLRDVEKAADTIPPLQK